ncbi:MAG TPA: DALR anticodon-binding domain-containing protein [Allocoleopsis sp.]
MWQQPANDIAAQLITLLCQEQAPLSISSQDADYWSNLQVYRSVWQNFKIYALPTGWIHLELRAIGLAEWLQLLVNPLPIVENPALLEVPSAFADRRNSTKAFEILYTYSRCTALLQLGNQAKLVQLAPNLNAAGVPTYMHTPCPLPWLNSHQQLRWHEPSELELLAQIIEGWDALGMEDLCWEQRWKTAYRLSQTFQGFYRSCRIFGEVATTTPELAQTRLGLVLMTQILLHHLVSSMLPLAIDL